MRDRTAEIARPLLAVADLAGGRWPATARNALVELLTGEAREDASFGVRLLADVRRVFEEQGVSRIKTVELLWALSQIEESPWGDWFGKSLSAHALSKMLVPFGIKTMPVWVEGEKVRGYKREQFEDAWSRYLSVQSGSDGRGGSDDSVRDVRPTAPTAPTTQNGGLTEEELAVVRRHPDVFPPHTPVEQIREHVPVVLRLESAAHDLRANKEG